jgi:hypothetical protein
MISQKTIKGNRWPKDGSLKRTFHEIKEDKVVSFCEKQKDGTQDIVDISYKVRDNQYGEYSEEYLPDTVEKVNHNVIDITAILLDEVNKKGQWYLLDVKDSIGGEDVIFHLIDQWKNSYMYLKNSVLCYVSELEFDEHIGVVTRILEGERIKMTIKKKKEATVLNENIASSIACAKKRNANIRLEQEIKCLEDFLAGKFEYEDSYGKKIFTYVIVTEKTENEKDYYAQITLEIN